MTRIELNNIMRPFTKKSTKKAWFQIANTVLPYLVFLVGMYYLIRFNVPYIFVLLFSIIPALFLVRIFILFHDCTHSSFIKNKKLMAILGHVFGTLVFTPFYKWQDEHLTHHRTVGNLEKRGTGDVWTLTVDEYQASKWYKKLGYRLYRNPLVLFLIGPSYVFLLSERLPFNIKSKKALFSVILTNVLLTGIILTVSFTIGFNYYLLIQLPVIIIAATLGVWLFYVQHQYEDVYWEENSKWDITEAALKGSSVYKLPFLLRWFTGSIGYHNIHHLNARVPNYNLHKLHKKHTFAESKQFKIFSSFKLMTLTLYDFKERKLISFRRYKKLYA